MFGMIGFGMLLIGACGKCARAAGAGMLPVRPLTWVSGLGLRLAGDPGSRVSRVAETLWVSG